MGPPSSMHVADDPWLTPGFFWRRSLDLEIEQDP
jgi:hypothetical protein